MKDILLYLLGFFCIVFHICIFCIGDVLALWPKQKITAHSRAAVLILTPKLDYDKSMCIF